MKDMMKLDANESAFFERELNYIKAKTYDTKLADLQAFSVFPISEEVPSGMTQVTFRRYTGVGFAKIIADYARDFPRVDVYGTEETAKVQDAGAAYGYSIKEIRASQLTGKRLDQRRASYARRAIDELIDTIAWEGNAEYNIPGFIDYPGISEYTVPADGTGSSKTWAAKTAALIIRDLNGLVGTVISNTNRKEIPDTIILPSAQYELIAGMFVGTTSDKTVLKWYLENSPHIKQIIPVNKLDGAGAGSTDRMMAFKKDPECVQLEIPVMFEQFSPQQKGMDFEVPCHAETAGVIVYFPLSVAFGDGI